MSRPAELCSGSKPIVSSCLNTIAGESQWGSHLCAYLSLSSCGHPIMYKKISPSVSPRFFSQKEVAKHCTKDSCWVLLGTRVYDVTGFLRMHPGGEALILRRSGKDISREIDGPPHRHSENARRWMEQYYIGELDRDSTDEDTEVSP